MLENPYKSFMPASTSYANSYLDSATRPMTSQILNPWAKLIVVIRMQPWRKPYLGGLVPYVAPLPISHSSEINMWMEGMISSIFDGHRSNVPTFQPPHSRVCLVPRCLPFVPMRNLKAVSIFFLVILSGIPSFGPFFADQRVTVTNSRSFPIMSVTTLITERSICVTWRKFAWK